jgi:hypothetical protein
MRIAMSALVVLALLVAGAADAATITPTIAQAAGYSTKMAVYTWSGMAGTDTAVSAPAGHCIDLTVQVTGTFGTTTVTLTGSMDDTTYATLNDTAGTPAALSFTANGYKHVQELANYLKPGLSGGTGTALKVVVLCQQSP